MSDIENVSENDIDWCMETLDEVSRTFSVPIRMIDRPRTVYVATGYLLCRISDTIEDSPHLKIEQKNMLFDLYEEIVSNPEDKDQIDTFLNKCTNLKPNEPNEPTHWELVMNTDRLFRIYSNFDEGIQDCIEEPVLEMIDGMRDFCNRHPDGIRIETNEELENYCYYVAGTVGNMLSNIVIYQNSIDKKDEIRSRAQEFGSLLQHVNITKDIYEDYIEENNIYVPKSELNKYKIDQEKIIENDKSPKVVDEMIQRTSNKVESARKYLKILSKVNKSNTRSWSIPYLLAVATLRELENNSEEVLHGDVKIDREEVYKIVEEVKKSDYERILRLEEIINDKPLEKAQNI